MSDLTVKELNKVLKNIKSICITCKGNGVHLQDTNTHKLCEDCGAKGYQSFEELILKADLKKPRNAL